ncbi:hypothetical protein ACJJTC_013071 [Scirpophaga incertulas]
MDRFKQRQYQLQQQKYRELERQRQLDSAQARARNQSPTIQIPRQFAQTTPGTTESFSTRSTDEPKTTTELNLNEGETLDDNRFIKDKKSKVTVEVSKQKIQEYPGELFLSSLAQLQLQPQFLPLQQFGQLQAPAPIYYQQQIQNQESGYDASTHFAALPSVLAQRQMFEPPQAVYQNPQSVNPALLVASQSTNTGFIPPQPINNQYQPQLQGFPRPVIMQGANQPNQIAQTQSETNDIGQSEQEPIFVYQQSYQPQEVVYQSQSQIPNQYQAEGQQNVFIPQAQIVNYANQIPQQYQNGFIPQQFSSQPQVYQGQDALQSGLDVDQQGNDVDQDKDDSEDDQDDRSTATAVATAFGTRTQPRVYTRYGAPALIPGVAVNSQPTSEVAIQHEQATENTETVAEANAFAGGRRKSAKLRSRRVRPVFTLDRSGHLVLAQEQN